MAVLERETLRERLLGLILKQQTPPITPPTRERPQIAWDTRPQFQRPAPQMQQIPPIRQPLQQPPQAPQAVRAPLQTQPSQSPAVRAEEPEPTLPFWKRALEVFAAPFKWVDDYVIQPGLAILGTTAGFVDEVKRNPGEDYWEWKRRSWAGWKVPGININVPWGDDIRIDFKGIMELAPWLLIPGAGVVGTGTRAARGIAGLAGKIAKPLGYVIEYSPWGLVEKTAGVALKKGIQTASAIGGKISTKIGDRFFGKIPPPPPPTPEVLKLTKAMRETYYPGVVKFEKELPALRAKQEAITRNYMEQARLGKITASEANLRINRALKGSLSEQFKFTPEALKMRQAKAIAEVEAKVVSGEYSEAIGRGLITKIQKSPAYTAPQFTKETIEPLMNTIYKEAEYGLVGHESANALRELLMLGTKPQPHHLRDWAKVFGNDFAKAVNELGKHPQSFTARMVDALNLPRAVLATLDLSATFRQGLILGLTHPRAVLPAFWKQLKFFASEKLSLQMDDMLRSRSLYRNAVESGVEFTAIRRGASRFKEEPFFSNLAENIPFVRRSERAFTGYLNEMRMSTYEAAYGAMTAQGATKAQFNLLGDFINAASGRGTLPRNLDKYAPLLNTVLFSPRYQMSTLMLPKYLGKMLLSKNPYMRKEAAKALITFVGGGAALLGLLKTTGVGKVETDPRSGDFGKLVIGETRFDIWRGYVQYARFATQMLTGESISANKNLNKKERFETASRFLQSKASPAAGLMVDLLKGENYLGEPIFTETTGFIKQVRDRLLPLAVQDTIDAMEASGTNGIFTAIPAALGIGVLTYVNDFVRTQNKIAREMGYDNWGEIDPKTQREIENTNTELQVAQISLDRQVMGTAWGDYRLAGKAVEDVFRENIDKATAEFQQTGDGYLFREKVSQANTARRGGYDARDKEARFSDIVERNKIQDPLESDVSVGPEQMAIRLYNDALFADDMYDEFGNYKFEEADIRKQELISQLGQEMFDYVEEYRGVKYQDYPPIYQELVKARKILKPYWEVQKDADRYFGLMDSSNKRDFIKRRRDLLKGTNPMIAYYVRLFYTQK